MDLNKARTAVHPLERLSWIRQHGSVITEYTITTAIVITALFIPIPGVGLSAVDFVIQALNGFQDHSTVFLSMP